VIRHQYPPAPPCATSDDAHCLRFMIRPSTRGDAGFAIGYGPKIGYWPCLQAPFVQFSIHHWVFEIWFGLPSYKAGGLS
jgi:hypothetical protein